MFSKSKFLFFVIILFFLVTSCESEKKKMAVQKITPPSEFTAVWNHDLKAVVLKWNKGRGAEKYKIEKMRSDLGRYEFLGYFPATTSTAIDTNVISGIIYRYRIRSTGKNGYSDYVTSNDLFIPDEFPPETRITELSDIKIYREKVYAEFTFEGYDNYSTSVSFECRNDGGEWEECESPYTTNQLSLNSSHTFEVRAIDESGNIDPTPSKITWTPILRTKWSIITSGEFSNCAIDMSSKLYCWGYNAFGMLGVGDEFIFSIINFPMQVEDPLRWEYIDTGVYHTCGLTTIHQLYCWGANNAGQLGLGNNISYSTPQRVSFASWLSVSVGGQHTCAIAGGLYCWGSNAYGQLGIGNYSSKDRPTLVGNGWIAVDTGRDFTCGIKNDNTLWCWGSNGHGQLGIGSGDSSKNSPQQVGTDTNWIKVALGYYHACGLKDNGELYCWGFNYFGQLGTGNTTDYNTPQRVNGTWEDVVAFGNHTCALKSSDNSWYCWGDNMYASMGLENDAAHYTSPVKLIGADSVIQISSGGRHLCYIDSNNYLRCVGENINGQLGIGENGIVWPPKKVEISGKIVTADASRTGLLIVDNGGEVYYAGSNDYGQIGSGYTGGKIKTPQPVQNQTLSNISDGCTGENYNCALQNDGTLYCWGKNDSGQLGLGDTSDRASPEIVSGNWKEIECSKRYTCGIDESNNLYCWGENGSGQLGDGTDIDKSSPTLIHSNWKKIATGDTHTCGIDAENYLYCWGSNYRGKLGTGDTISSNTPVLISFEKWKDVAINNNSSCAIKIDGSLYCWGYHYNYTPLQVGNDSNWIKIEGYGENFCALKSDGTLYCWGRDNYGQLDGIEREWSEYFNEPVPMPGEEWTDVYVGEYQICALNSSGDLYCWGKNIYGATGVQEDYPYSNYFWYVDPNLYVEVEGL